MTRIIGFLLFPNVQQLDLTGPYDVLYPLPDSTLHLVSKTLEPVTSSSGMRILPSTTFDTCPPLDILIVPGGIGINDLILDREAVAFVRRTALQATYIGSVCTGSLLLGVAGLLRGKRATTHWAYHSLLSTLGAQPVKARVVRDGNLFTGGGVTAGIDFALTLFAEIAGDDAAMATQLSLEYAPSPPFDAGSPDTAPSEILAKVQDKTASALNDRRERIRQALELHN